MCAGLEEVTRRILEIKNNPDTKKLDDELLVTFESCYEFYKRGFRFENVDIYASDAVKFEPIGSDALRPPLIAVAGLGETAAQNITESRRGREFVSIEEFSASCPKVSSAHIAEFRKLGAFEDLPESSQFSLF